MPFHTVPDGLKIHFRDEPPTGPASGPPVLCLHGLTRNGKDFDDIVPKLAALGRRVIVPDQRGRGASDRDADPMRYEIPVYAGDMLHLLAALKIDVVATIGTSMGGLISMAMALPAPTLWGLLRRPSKAALMGRFMSARQPVPPGAPRAKIAQAIINDVAPKVEMSGIARIIAAVSETAPAASWEEAIARTREAEQRSFPEETDDAYWRAFAKRLWKEEAPGRLVRDFDPAIIEPIKKAKPQKDPWWLFDGLKTTPTLVIRGALSDVLSRDAMAQMKSRGAAVETVEVSQTGHAPHLTEAEAWAAIERFLRTTENRTSQKR